MDLPRFVEAASAIQAADESITLLRFLGSLRVLLLDFAGGDEDKPVPFEQFLEMLQRSATDPAGNDGEGNNEQGDPMLKDQQQVLAGLVADGVYNNQHRGFGVRGADGDAAWSNFGVNAYIECGCAGAFGDDGTRELSGGEGAEAFRREDLHKFFDCGRFYE